MRHPNDALLTHLRMQDLLDRLVGERDRLQRENAMLRLQLDQRAELRQAIEGLVARVKAAKHFADLDAKTSEVQCACGRTFRRRSANAVRCRECKLAAKRAYQRQYKASKANGTGVH